MNGIWQVQQMNQSVTFSRKRTESMTQLKKLLLVRAHTVTHTHTQSKRKRRDEGKVWGSERK